MMYVITLSLVNKRKWCENQMEKALSANPGRPWFIFGETQLNTHDDAKCEISKITSKCMGCEAHSAVVVFLAREIGYRSF